MRLRLLWVSLAFGLGASLTWYFRTQIFHYLLAPAEGQLSPDGKPIFISPTEMLGMAISLSIKGGLIAAFPVAVYHLYSFLRRLLSRSVKRFIFWFLPLGLVCYLAGTVFAYFVLLPTGLDYLLQFGTDIATPMIRITDYMAMATALLFWLGVVFELPLIMLLLSKLGVVDHRRFARLRRYVPVTAFTLSAIITPTFDPVNSTLVAVPLIVLYEIGVFLSWLARPRRARA